MTLVGFSGYARSGKDTAVALLADEGYKRIAFADKLREVLYALNPIVVDSAPMQLTVKQGTKVKNLSMPGYENFQHIYVQDVIDKYTWDGYKETPYSTEIRRLLQRLGTEAGRNAMWDSIWVDAALKVVDEHPYDLYAVSDCRFVNEAKAIQERGGKMIRITRPGVGPANDHPSETSLDDYPFDAAILNDGTLEDLKRKIKECL